MKKYKVYIAPVIYKDFTLEVEADSEDEAEEEAFQEAWYSLYKEDIELEVVRIDLIDDGEENIERETT